jgi:hypothetical protein
MSVGSTYVDAISVPHRLYDTDVVSAVKMLQQKENYMLIPLI